jgi:hypothetical protein
MNAYDLIYFLVLSALGFVGGYGLSKGRRR